MQIRSSLSRNLSVRIRATELLETLVKVFNKTLL